MQAFQLQADLDSLRMTMEDHLPYFNSLESENKKMKYEIQHVLKKDLKSHDILSNKIRNLERKLAD